MSSPVAVRRRARSPGQRRMGEGRAALGPPEGPRRRAAEPLWSAGLLLGGMIVAYVAVFGYLAWRNQSRYYTTGFDIGIHDQAIWLAAHGKPLFDTVRGLDYFGENVNLISLAFVPFYWLSAGPHFLIVANTLALGSAALPLWLIARERIGSPHAALIPPACYLLYPTTGYLSWWGYHPDSFMIAPLCFAWWFALRGRWGYYSLCVAAALSCKEDAALAVLAMGLVVAIWPGFRRDRQTTGPRRVGARHSGRARSSSSPAQRWGAGTACWRRALTSPDGTRQAGLLSVVAGLVWFEICARVILPVNNSGLPPFYSSYFWSLGRSPQQVVGNAIRHPSRVAHLAALPTRRTYYVQMFVPVGLVFLLGLPAFLVGLPALAINVVDQGELGATITSQYSTLVVVGVFLGTIEALGRIRRRGPRLLQAALGLLVCTTVASTVAWGITPLGVRFHTWWPGTNPQGAQIAAALRRLPPQAGVAVTYNLTPHVTHRVYAYEFPNPWVNVNWLSTRVPERPSTVSWIVVDTDLLDPADQLLLGRLTARGGAFRVVYRDNGILAAQRAR